MPLPGVPTVWSTQQVLHVGRLAAIYLCASGEKLAAGKQGRLLVATAALLEVCCSKAVQKHIQRGLPPAHLPVLGSNTCSWERLSPERGLARKIA